MAARVAKMQKGEKVSARRAGTFSEERPRSIVGGAS